MIIAFGVGNRFSVNGQCRRRLQPGWAWFIQQVTQAVEYMSLGQDTGINRITHGLFNEILVVLQYQRQNIGHLSITARPL